MCQCYHIQDDNGTCGETNWHIMIDDELDKKSKELYYIIKSKKPDFGDKLETILRNNQFPTVTSSEYNSIKI